MTTRPEVNQRENQLDEILTAYLEAVESGHAPDKAQWLARYPELLPELTQFLDDHNRFSRMAVMLRPEEAATSHGSTTPSVGKSRTSGPEIAPGMFGDYELLREIGRGGMGVVYEARQRSLNRLVALKMMRTSRLADQGDVERFRYEAKTAAALDHPNIVPIHEVGELGGHDFYGMKLVDGGSLAQHLSRLAQTPAVVVRLLCKVARAVHCAHQHGLLHRDLKPANVLLEVRRDHGSSAASGSPPALCEYEPYVTDFGLAKWLENDSALTHAGTIVGTPSYMAPEQAAGSNPLTTAADIYSLGAILYEALTGHAPAAAETRQGTLQNLLFRDPRRPRDINRHVDRDLETICLKCLERDPHRRYGSADALADDLERWLAGEPIVARPVSRRERCYLWCRRNPVVAALTASVATLLVVVAAVLAIAAVRLGRERDNVEANLQRAVRAEQETTDRLWESYTARARAERRGQHAGRRFNGLEALTRAAKIRPSMELRNEAIACLALADLRVATQWDCNPNWKAIDFDAELDRFAAGDQQGNISICRVSDQRELLRLPGSGVHPVIVHFSPDGRYLAAKYHNDSAIEFRAWDLQRRQAVVHLHDGQFSDFASQFSPDSRFVAVSEKQSDVCLYELASGTQVKRLVVGSPLNDISFHPDGHRLALARTMRTPIIQIWDLDNAKVAHTLNLATMVYAIAWHPDGESLATACADARVYVWPSEGVKPRAVLEGHQSQVVGLSFSPAGDVLASRSWDGTTRLWEVATGRTLATTAGTFVAFARSDDSKLGFSSINRTQIGIWDIARGRECRGLARGAAGFSRTGDFSRDGRLLASAGDEGVAIFNVSSAKELAFLPLRDTRTAIICPAGNRLITCSRQGVYRWPIRATDQNGELTIGPPERIARGATTPVQCSLSADGHTLAVIDSAPLRTTVFDLQEARQPVVLQGTAAIISADGRWLASSTWPVSNVKLWDARTGEFLRTLAEEKACGRFSPDGRWLVTGRPDKHQFWHTASWEPGPSIPWEGVGDLPGCLAFSRDSAMLAVQSRRNELALIDVPVGGELARIEIPDTWQFAWISLSPNGSHLAAQCADYILLWDLQLIRERLATMGLDWTSTAGPNRADTAGPTFSRARVDLGKLGGATPRLDNSGLDQRQQLQDAARPDQRR